MKSATLALVLCAAIICGCTSQASVQQAAADARKAANQGAYKAEAADLNPVVDADSQDPQAYMARAYAYLEAGENQRAISDATRAVELEPDAAFYLLARSLGYVRAGEFDRALEDTNTAIQLAPNAAGCWGQRGFVYMSMGDGRSAFADFTHAIKLDPNSVIYRVQRGFALGMQGRYAEAQRDWETAVRMRPDYGPSYSALGWLQATCPDAKFRDAKKAVENAKRGAKLGAPTMLAALVSGGAVASDVKPKPGQDRPALAWPLDALAAAYAEAGDFRQAVAVQQQAIACNRTTPNPLATKEQKLLALYQQKQPYRAGFDSVVPELPWISLPS
ncbi:MAG: tetratricopeptide repeat protein [Candidatus Binataceae bacterium]